MLSEEMFGLNLFKKSTVCSWPISAGRRWQQRAALSRSWLLRVLVKSEAISG
jgi:hypothetical protein